MLINEVKLGTQVQIAQKGVGAEAKPLYTSRVETVENGQSVLIHTPAEKGRRVRLVERTPYELIFITGSWQINFNAKFVEEVRVERFYMLRFTLVGEGVKTQRRNAFRFACNIEFAFNIMHGNGEQSDLLNGVIRDLSSGGIKITTPANIPENALLRIDLPLGETVMMCFGVVRMKRHTPENISNPYTYGISFEVMSEREEERIVKFVYDEQRKLLRRPQRALYNISKK